MPANDPADDLFPAPTRFDLRCGDCVAGMASLPGESIDLVVTSPPYNLGIAYRTYRDRMQDEDYLEWTRAWTREVRRLLAPGGSFFLNIAASSKNPWLPHEALLQMRGDFQLQNTFHWIKSICVERPSGEQLSVGHFKPIQSQRYVNDCHEYLFHFTLQGDVPLDRRAAGVPYQDKSNIDRWGHTGGADRRCRGNTWFIPYPTINSRDRQRPHPASFPAELAERCIQLHGRDRVQAMLDPFLGIGHAAEAAARQSVPRFFGFEIDPEYLRYACERLRITPPDLPSRSPQP